MDNITTLQGRMRAALDEQLERANFDPTAIVTQVINSWIAAREKSVLRLIGVNITWGTPEIMKESPLFATAEAVCRAQLTAFIEQHVAKVLESEKFKKRFAPMLEKMINDRLEWMIQDKAKSIAAKLCDEFGEELLKELKA